MFKALCDHLGSYQRALEIFFLLNKAKPCVRLLVHDNEHKEIINFLKSKNIYTLKAKNKIELKKDKGKNFSNKAHVIPQKQQGWNIVLCGLNDKIIQLAKVHEDKHEHYEMGLLLGYPPCCAHFFAQNFREQSKKANEYILCTPKNKELSAPWQNNVLLRCFDKALLSHFPCNMDCKKSKNLGKTYLKTLPQDIQEKLKEQLSVTVIYTETQGIHILKEAKKDNNIITYKKTLSTKNNELQNMLNKEKKVKIIDNHNIIIGDTLCKNVIIAKFS